jgi:hypothetical protein
MIHQVPSPTSLSIIIFFIEDALDFIKKYIPVYFNSLTGFNCLLLMKGLHQLTSHGTALS